MKIGVLALQGDFDAHRRRLQQLGAEVLLVKKPEQLDEVDGLVIPGGESTTFLKLLGEAGVAKLREFARLKPTFGTCAGAILLAAQVENPAQPGLAALDVLDPEDDGVEMVFEIGANRDIGTEGPRLAGQRNHSTRPACGAEAPGANQMRRQLPQELVRFGTARCPYLAAIYLQADHPAPFLADHHGG